jgi:cytochrome c-type biogenesis protein
MLILVSFLAGVLTVLAPCVLPLLPVVIGKSASDSSRNKLKPMVVIGALSLSIIFFTLLLKATTLFITIPDSFWEIFAGVVLILFAVTLIFPKLWDTIIGKTKLNQKANMLAGKGNKRNDLWGDAIIGFALGPIFSSCSPTYLVIISVVLPQSFLFGFVNLLAYVLGLAAILFPIAIFGQKFVSKLGWLSDSKGTFKKVIGILFLILGLLIATGTQRDVETWLIDQGYIPAVNFENDILNRVLED